uniref:Uncharacterized protein n=1 Tax=Wuchereria bancrofti TaxID=6293 RepID=A0AAF5PKD2_WUCBA
MEGKEKGMDRWVNEWVKDGVTGGGGRDGGGGGGGGGSEDQTTIRRIHANIFGLFIVD